MLVTTPAIVLHAFPYGETSKIVRLCTRDHGVQSVIAKGAARPKSRFGARLQVLSEGTAQLYLKPTRDLQTLAAFDVTEQHAALATDLPRFVAATAVAELVLRCSPAEPHPEIHDHLVESLAALESCPAARLPYVELAALWSTVVGLGFAPAVDACARCGEPLAARAHFSVADGGLLCARCGTGAGGGTLDERDQAALAAFVQGATEIPALPEKHLAAHRRLLVRFIDRHLAEDRELKALAFWEGDR